MMIHEHLYRIVYETLEKYDTESLISERAALAIYGKNPNVVNVNEFSELKNEDFLRCVYYRCLDRTPDEAAYGMLHDETIKKRFKTESERKLFILLIVIQSEEFKNSQKSIVGIDDYWKAQRKGGEISSAGNVNLRIMQAKDTAKQVYKSTLHPVWMKVPYEKRQRIKRLFHR